MKRRSQYRYRLTSKLSRLEMDVYWVTGDPRSIRKLIGDFESVVNELTKIYAEVASKHKGWVPSMLLTELEQVRGVAKSLIYAGDLETLKVIASSLVTWLKEIREDIIELDSILPESE